MTPSLWQKAKLKSLLVKVKKVSEKVGLKLKIQKTKIMISGPIRSGQVDGETMETGTEFILGAPKSLKMVTVASQAPLSMESSRQEHWSGLPFPSPGDLPNPGIEPRSPALQANSLPTEPPGKP